MRARASALNFFESALIGIYERRQPNAIKIRMLQQLAEPLISSTSVCVCVFLFAYNELVYAERHISTASSGARGDDRSGTRNVRVTRARSL